MGIALEEGAGSENGASALTDAWFQYVISSTLVMLAEVAPSFN